MIPDIDYDEDDWANEPEQCDEYDCELVLDHEGPHWNGCDWF